MKAKIAADQQAIIAEKELLEKLNREADEKAAREEAEEKARLDLANAASMAKKAAKLEEKKKL